MILILLPSLAEAVDIYGRVRVKKSGQVAAYAKVIIDYGSTQKSVFTDGNGVYRFSEQSVETQCSISVFHNKKHSNSFIIYLSKNRTRANFDLEDRNDLWRLIRR
jgi:hypothetical protein